MSFFFKRKQKTIPPNATFRLTQEGKEKLQEFGGDPKSRVLMALETAQSSCDIDEISHGSGLSIGQLERLLPQMVRAGYIQYVGVMSEE